MQLVPAASPRGEAGRMAFPNNRAVWMAIPYLRQPTFGVVVSMPHMARVLHPLQLQPITFIMHAVSGLL